MNTLWLLGHKLTTGMAFITCDEAEHNTVHTSWRLLNSNLVSYMFLLASISCYWIKVGVTAYIMHWYQLTKAIRDGEETVVDRMTEVDVTHSRGGECSTNDFEVSDGTALHWAAYYGKVEIAKKCLERGASKLTYLWRIINSIFWVPSGEAM